MQQLARRRRSFIRHKTVYKSVFIYRVRDGDYAHTDVMCHITFYTDAVVAVIHIERFIKAVFSVHTAFFELGEVF